MLEPGDPVLAAVSGGPDSVALLLSLLHLKQTHDLTIGIAHLNHRLRGEDALKDEAFVRDLAEHFSLPFFCGQQDVAAYAGRHRLSVEEAGREVRYDFFPARLINTAIIKSPWATIKTTMRNWY
nr:hypothetical protein [Desulfobacula sp.]